MTGAGPTPTAALCGATVVVSLDPPEVVVGDLVLAGDRVASIGTAPSGVTRRDCSGTLIVPGNVCAHHHLYSALARGMPFDLAPPVTFTEILQRVWWRLDRALDEAAVRASAIRGGLDALRAGTTTVIDHHASPAAIDGSLDIIADALGEVGVRSVLCYEVSDRDGEAAAKAGIAENRRFLRSRRPFARGLVGAHASFTLSDETLAACVDAAAQAGVGVHIHVAEDGVDRGAVNRLDAAGVITDKALLAHCVHTDASEIALVESREATVVCNPRSNMNNAVGRSPFNQRPGRVALGTDGIGGDLFAESQAGYFRAREDDRQCDPGWPLVHLAESARLAGRLYGEESLGSLRPGAPADLAVLDYRPPTPLTAANLAGHWVYGLSSGQVRDVYVDGRPVVAGGRSTLLDEAEVAAESAVEAERLWGRLAATPAHNFQPRG